MPETVWIVGNADVAATLGDDIDASDCVVRFNMARTFGVNTGTRCDVLCVNNTGRPARRLARDALLRSASFAKSAGTILFPRPRQPAWKHLVLRAVNRTSDLEYSERIVAANELRDKQIIHLDPQFVDECLRDLLRLGRPPVRPRVPSTGYLALTHILRTRPNANINMAGFTFAGWKRHPFGLERAMVERHVRDGRVCLVA